MTTYTTNVHNNARRNRAQPSFWRWLGTVFSARKQRKSLLDLDEHLLKDIGLTREAAEREASRRIWDVPEYWLR